MLARTGEMPSQALFALDDLRAHVLPVAEQTFCLEKRSIEQRDMREESRNISRTRFEGCIVAYMAVCLAQRWRPDQRHVCDK